MARHGGLDVLRIATGACFGFFAAAQFLLQTASGTSQELTHFVAIGVRVLTAASFVLAGTALGLRYGSSEIEYRAFISRRLLRLAPAFVFLLLFRTYGARGDFVFDRFLDAVLSLGYFPKSYADRPGIFAAVGWFSGPLLQLYLLFPFIHGFARARGWRWVAGLLALAVLGRYLALGLGAQASDLLGWTTLGRLDQFVLGYVLGEVLARGQRAATVGLAALVVGAIGLATRPWFAAASVLTEYREISPLLVGLVLAAGALWFLKHTSRLYLPGLAPLMPVLYLAQLFLLPVLDGMRHRGLYLFTEHAVHNTLINAAVVALPAAFGLGYLLHEALLGPIVTAIERRRVANAVVTAEVSPAPDALAAERAPATPLHSKNIGHLSALDHLRGLAALLVVAYHSHQGNAPVPAPGACRGLLWSLLLEGHSGVGLFMVLSGFVFMYGAQGSRVVYGKFIYNRLLRVYPLYIVLLLFAASGYRGMLNSFAVIQSLATLGNLQNSATNANNISGIAWTLSTEFQFYLLFPLLFAKLEAPRNARWTTVFVLSLLSLRLLVFCIGNDLYDMIYWTVFGRLSQFLIGMLAARAYRRWGSRPALFPLAIGLVLALHDFEHGHGSILAPGGPAWSASIDVCQGLVWAFLLVTYIPLAERLPRLFSTPLRWLGTISYSLYLLHYGLLVVFQRRHWFHQFVPDPHQNSLIVFTTMELPLLLLACALTYRVIERPFLAMRVRYLAPPALGTNP